MNEILLDEKLSDFELLARFQTQWKQARPEPFIQNPQEDVVIPIWNKVSLPQNNVSVPTDPSQSTGTYVTFNVIIGGQRWLVDIDSQNFRPA